MNGCRCRSFDAAAEAMLHCDLTSGRSAADDCRPWRGLAVRDSTTEVAMDSSQLPGLLATIMETSPVGIVVVDCRGLIVFANRRAEEVLGVAKDELTRRSYNAPQWQITDQQGRPVHDEELPFRRVMETRRAVYDARHCVARPDGARTHLSINAAPLVGSEGSLLGMVATVEDITERARAEERFRQLLESTPDAMIAVNPQGRITLANATAEQMFGYDRSELVGHELEMLVPERARAEHRRHVSEFFRNPRARPIGLGLDLTARRKSGEEFPVAIGLRPVDAGGEQVVFAAVRDMSEQKRVERELKDRESQLLAAHRIQEHLLPRDCPQLPGFDIAGASYPAVFAAGDHYDFLPMRGGQLGLIIGDVAGHGVGPALLMAATHTLLRVLVQMHGELDLILDHANRFLHEEVEEDRFVTLLFACLDPVRRTLVYGNAGHPTGYVLDQAGSVKARLESMTTPLAVDPGNRFDVSEPIPLEPGETVVLLTDGVLEAASPTGEAFGEARALQIVAAQRRKGAATIIEALHRAVRDFSGQARLADDVTVVVVRVLDIPRQTTGYY